MTSPDDEFTDPLEVMRSAPVGVATPGETTEERERLVPWLEGRVSHWAEERARRRRRRAVGGALLGLGLAAAAAASFVVWSRAEPTEIIAQSPHVRESASEVRLVEGSVESENAKISTDSRFAPASHVRTRTGGHAVFVREAAYRLEMRGQSEVVFGDEPSTSQRTRIRLVAGEIDLAVRKLAPGRTLEIETSDATVRVKGTRFVVRTLERDAVTTTCVVVSEGLVEVERASGRTLLRAGESSGCDVEQPGSVEASSVAPSKTSSPKSSLTEESRLLATALSAEKSGHVEEARATFAELLRRYPHSRFSPEARAGLARAKAESAPK